MKSRWYRAALLAGGMALLSYLVARIGPASVLASFRVLSWRLVLVAFFPCVVFKLLDVLAWRYAFPTTPPPFSRLTSTLLAGQAVALTTPTGTFGGDAVRAWMLRDQVSLRESLPSLVLFKTTASAAQGCVLLIGILVARWTLAPDTALVRIMELLLLLETIGVVGFVAVQMRGVMGGGHRLLERFGFSGGAAMGEAAEHIDQALATFYRSQPGRLALSFVFNFLAWVASACEVWLILYFLGQPVSPATAFVIEAFGTGIAFATFFIPGQVGVAEGGAVATFIALGLSAATGLSFSLVRRVREVTWIGIGLLLLAARPIPSPTSLRSEAA